jgi:hypothetical protein
MTTADCKRDILALYLSICLLPELCGFWESSQELLALQNHAIKHDLGQVVDEMTRCISYVYTYSCIIRQDTK